MLIAFFFFIVALFGIFFFYILRLFLAYLVPGILYYNYSYDFNNFLRFPSKNRRIAPLELMLHSSVASPYSNVGTLRNFIPLMVILSVDSSQNYFSTCFKTHNFSFHNHRFFVLYNLNSEVKLISTFILPVSNIDTLHYGYYFSFCNPKVFFVINSKIFLTNF